MRKRSGRMLPFYIDSRAGVRLIFVPGRLGLCHIVEQKQNKKKRKIGGQKDDKCEICFY